ncbi:kinase-like protein [Gigaspora margarita]|uniref:Kinase-like protein n=1 Tax=Gigaspora margarita TaxID=4874 RepID=A0A8H4ABK3_GIGMA|nr:kinase-like protein [Gigaspora margarita]
MLSQQQGHYATKACSNCQQRHVKCSGKVTCNYCKLRDLERVFIKDHKKCEPKLKQNYQSENNYKKLNLFNTGFTTYQNESIIGIKFYQLVWKDLKDEFKTSNIKEFDYSLFNDQKQVGNGEFSIVYSANFKGETYALKSLNNNLSLNSNKLKNISRKLKALYTVEHPNVIKFYGTSEHPIMGNFIMVLQFANNGSLCDYLQSKYRKGVFKNSWNETIQIAKEISLGLKHLHEKGIIHKNLNSKNILMNDGKPLIADFGLSKYIEDYSSPSCLKGMPAYIEPQCIIQHGKKVKRDERSDIYSMGVLMWELTSGTQPFSDLMNNYAISVRIFFGDREKIIPGTPQEYADLYTSCWSSKPEKRPTLDRILNDLDGLLTETTCDFNLTMQSTPYNDISSKIDIKPSLVVTTFPEIKQSISRVKYDKVIKSDSTNVLASHGIHKIQIPREKKSYGPVLEKLTPKSASQINSFQPVLKSRVTIKNKVRRSTRPPNAFFLYRREKIKEFEAKGERISIVEVSKIIAGMWKKESPIVKIEFDRMAVLECEKFFNQELGFMRLSCRRKTKFKIYKPYNVENSKKSAETTEFKWIKSSMLINGAETTELSVPMLIDSEKPKMSDELNISPDNGNSTYLFKDMFPFGTRQLLMELIEKIIKL